MEAIGVIKRKHTTAHITKTAFIFHFDTAPPTPPSSKRWVLGRKASPLPCTCIYLSFPVDAQMAHYTRICVDVNWQYFN